MHNDRNNGKDTPVSVELAALLDRAASGRPGNAPFNGGQKPETRPGEDHGHFGSGRNDLDWK